MINLEKTDAVFLMEPVSGIVQTEEEWRADYARMPAELWGGENFEDAELYPVTLVDGEWRLVNEARAFAGMIEREVERGKPRFKEELYV